MKVSMQNALCTLSAVIGIALCIMGGCGGNGRIIVDPPFYSTITLTFRDAAGNSPDGSGLLVKNRTQISFVVINGKATIHNVPPGTYKASGRVGNISFSQTLVVNNEGIQNFIYLPPGLPTTEVTGKLYTNKGDPITGRCANPTANDALTDRVLIRARNRNTGLIVASVVRERQPTNTLDDQKGAFRISVPDGSYVLEVRQAPPISVTEHSTPYAGNSIFFTTPQTTVLTICVNEGTVAPNHPPPYRPTPTPGPSPTPTPGGPPPVPTPTQVGPPPPPFGN